MSQNDLVIANQSFPATRADINSALQALGSLNSGATEPATTYAHMPWSDTTTDILKVRSAANDAWINIGYFDQSANAFRILDDTQVTNTSGTQTGLLGDQATATWETGTSTTESLVSPAKVKAAVIANRGPDYTSAEISVPLSGSTTSTLTHGLGSTPTTVSVVMVCKVATNGYSVGDTVACEYMTNDNNTQVYGLGVKYTDTNIRAVVGSGGLYVIDFTDGDGKEITRSNWRLVFRAWA
jgi:hypothetical protein